MEFFRKIVVILVVIFVLQGCDDFGQDLSPMATVNTSTGRYGFDVDVVISDEERAKGLMGRESMGLDEGMLFFFDKPQVLSFWMKNMKFPIDIIFIGADQKVVSMAKEVPPCEKDPCPSYLSDGDAQYVLEINSGLAKEIGLSNGDLIEWRLK